MLYFARMERSDSKKTMSEKTVWHHFSHWGVARVTKSESGEFHTIQIHRPIATTSTPAAIRAAQKVTDRMDRVFEETGRMISTPFIPHNKEDEAIVDDLLRRSSSKNRFEKLEGSRREDQAKRFEEILEYWESSAKNSTDPTTTALSRMATDHIRIILDGMGLPLEDREYHLTKEQARAVDRALLKSVEAGDFLSGNKDEDA